MKKFCIDLVVVIIILACIGSIYKLITSISSAPGSLLSLVKDSGFIFLLTFILISALAFAISKKIRDKLTEPAKYLFPIFIALSFSFGIVSFLFGIHSEVFTAYDQNEAGEFAFKWFRPAEILDFPISQLQLV